MMKAEPYTWDIPRNQTYEHFLLKNVGRVYLVERGLRYVGTEVFVSGMHDEHSNKKVVDCVGVDKRQEVSYGIEVKVSLSDFKSGYSTRCNYNYVMCPTGLIDKAAVPDYVGLIYADVENVMFVTDSREQRLLGVQCVKKAKYHVNGMFLTPEGECDDNKMFAYTQMLVERINRSNLNELLYHTNYVPLGRVVEGRARWKRKRKKG